MKIFILSLFISIQSLAASLITAPVNDYAKVLSPQTVSELNQTIQAQYKSNKGQLAVIIVDSLKGKPIEDFAQEAFVFFKLGSKDNDDGVLLVLSTQDRRTRIHTGYGVEGSLTDAKTKQILASLRPLLQQNNYDEAIKSGVNQIISVLNAPEGIQKSVVSSSARQGTLAEEKKLSGLSIFFSIGTALMLILSLMSYTEYRDHKRKTTETNQEVNSAIEKIIKVKTNYEKHLSQRETQEKSLKEKYSTNNLEFVNKYWNTAASIKKLTDALESLQKRYKDLGGQ